MSKISDQGVPHFVNKIPREIIDIRTINNLYEVGWSFAPASKYTHVTQVWASSEEEAYNGVTNHLKDETGKDIDAWVLRTVYEDRII